MKWHSERQLALPQEATPTFVEYVQTRDAVESSTLSRTRAGLSALTAGTISKPSARDRLMYVVIRKRAIEVLSLVRLPLFRNISWIV